MRVFLFAKISVQKYPESAVSVILIVSKKNDSFKEHRNFSHLI